MSAATIWEIAIKVGLSKLSLSIPYQVWMSQAIVDLGASILPVTVEFAGAQSVLPSHHRDPFDRLMIAQALNEGLTLISKDSVFHLYGVHQLW